jgi:hypothetical protein
MLRQDTNKTMTGVDPELATYEPPPACRAQLGPIIQLLKSAKTTVIRPFYGARIICKMCPPSPLLPGGLIYYDSQLAVDTDGSRFATRDRTGQARTAWQPRHRAVDADTVPYFSVNLPVFHDPRFGLRKGDIAAVIYHNTLAFAVLADVGGRHLGEGSLALHRALGHERVVHRGTLHERFHDIGIPGGVITVAFPRSGDPGSAELTMPNHIQARGLQLWWTIRRVGDFPAARSETADA